MKANTGIFNAREHAKRGTYGLPHKFILVKELPQEVDWGDYGESQYRSMWMGGIEAYPDEGYCVELHHQMKGARGSVTTGYTFYCLIGFSKTIAK